MTTAVTHLWQLRSPAPAPMEPTPLHGLYVHTFMSETEKESKADQETDSGRETGNEKEKKNL